MQHGPDPCFQEPGGQDLDDGFSTNLESSPFLIGPAKEYARGKARQFPDEGGPVILAIDAPAEIVQKAVNEWFPFSRGLVQFDYGSGFEELLENWPSLAKETRSVP